MTLWGMCSQCDRYSKEIEQLRKELARLKAELDSELESKRRIGDLLFQQAVKKAKP